MDSQIRRRLTLGFVSNLIGKLGSSFIQLVQVPVFLHFWSVPLYGEWLIVNSIPTYLSFSNLGFGSVASNDMTMSVAGGNREQALIVFQSTWWLIVLLCGACGVLLAVAIYLFPVAHALRLSIISAQDVKWIIFYLGCAVLLGQVEQLLQAAYTCTGRYAYGNLIKNCISLAAFGATIMAVALHQGARVTALVFAAANMGGTVLLARMVRRDVPWIKFGWEHASFSEIRRLAGPAIAFMGFPVGNALNIQGSLLAVGFALGPVDVVIFGTSRTISRVALQIVQMVNMTFWPELSSASGAGDWPLVRALHRRACQMALAIALMIVTTIIASGPWLLNHWTGGHVVSDRPLLSILLLVVVFNALWSTSSTLVVAMNRHQKLSLYYICGTSVTIVVTYIAAVRIGLYGAAASLLISELVMNLYVLPNSLRVSQDTFPQFFASLFRLPSQLPWKRT